ncbi:MAG: type II toxin-antitoxin system HicA family toxin [Sphingomonadales bacterium]|nr:type II toxin-antitoxin system HicA family toxin [Sphingomonadales bacterium]
MSKADKLLERMRRNPAGDWTIGDVQRLCEALGWTCLPPSGGGSHWKVTAPQAVAIVTIPAKRPIKPIYIRKLIELARDMGNGKGEGETD